MDDFTLGQTIYILIGCFGSFAIGWITHEITCKIAYRLGVEQGRIVEREYYMVVEENKQKGKDGIYSY